MKARPAREIKLDCKRAAAKGISFAAARFFAPFRRRGFEKNTEYAILISSVQKKLRRFHSAQAAWRYAGKGAYVYYGIGILSAALNILGGAMLLFSIRADLVFNIATVAAGVMMLMLATNLKEDPRGRNFCLAAALLTVLGMVPGIVGIVCAAASWPVFAWPYFKASVPENGLHKAAFLVMVCGLVLLVGSFLPVPQMLAACIIIAVAAVQGLLAFLLYQEA